MAQHRTEGPTPEGLDAVSLCLHEPHTTGGRPILPLEAPCA
jgi:hypothetical protein